MKPIKLIFLDIDGVIAHTTSRFAAQQAGYDIYTQAHKHHQLDTNILHLIQYLQDIHQASIVISSRAWSFDTIAEQAELFANTGVELRLFNEVEGMYRVDYTIPLAKDRLLALLPEIVKHDYTSVHGRKYTPAEIDDNLYDIYKNQRGSFIQRYLDKLKDQGYDVDYICIDDDGDYTVIDPLRFIQVKRGEMTNGFNMSHYQKVDDHFSKAVTHPEVKAA